MNVQDIRFYEYIMDMMRGVRKYLLQENDGHLNAGRKHNDLLWRISIASQLFFIFLIWGTAVILSGWTFCELWFVPVILWVVISYGL